MDILVVDDNKINRMVLEHALKKQGHTVKQAKDGREAIRLFKKYRSELVLMDILMPEMNGHDATRKIKEIACDTYIPVIFVTALDSNEALTEALSSGGDDFLSKPFNLDVLESKINAHRRIKELYDQLEEKNCELVLHNRRLAHEQELASYFFDQALQQSYLDPKFIKYHLSPMSTFSGDLLLVQRQSMGGICALLGDFTGHGLSAAIGTLPAAHIFLKMVKENASICEIAREINRYLVTLLPIDMFCAAMLVEINATGNQLSVWNGALPNAYLINHESGSLTTITSEHMPLGILTDDEFDTTLQYYNTMPDERLYMCTDGITEAVNSDEELFGEDRVEALLSSFHDNLFDVVMDKVNLFRGEKEQQDDVSFVEMTVIETPALVNNTTIIDDSPILPWNISVTLEGTQLQQLNPIEPLMEMISSSIPLSEHKYNINIVLSELFSNAIEHGLLELDSSEKIDESGFISYYKKYEERLAHLIDGRICIDLSFQETSKGRKLLVKVSHNGKSLDYEKQENQPAPEMDKPYGRGIFLVSSLCQELIFSDQGRTAEASYFIPKGTNPA
ncbi:MAG: hypothetical protein DRJ10_20460 [Bacteroidetes bacterium]|nr:MAG: hypothetical protein DRJ10_20460 [Bacteroidota bacterium]